MSSFKIDARDGSARAGVLVTPHGEVRTPAFVPLATTATVKTLHASEVAELGYEMVLGNTFHLFIRPGHEHIARMGGLHEFMAWRRPIITDSGGFQVFSMGHGSVADEIKGRRGERESRILSIDEEGVRFQSYADGSPQFMGPETSMEVQAALGSDIALAFDECTPFHVDRDYTARSTARTHRWLDRCIDWQREHAPSGQLLFGIVQGGVYEDLRIESAERVTSSDVGGVAVGGSLGQEKAQMREVVAWVTAQQEDGLPDGMKVDSQGNLYCTGPGGVWVFSPDGKHLGTIKPPETPANCNWRHAHPPRPPWHRACAGSRRALAARPEEARLGREP